MNFRAVNMAFFWRRNKEDKFSSSVLGLDKSIEELKAQEAAVEKEIGVRFSKAIEKTRDSINNRLDTIFEGRKQIDEQLARRTRGDAHLDRHRRADDDAGSRSDPEGCIASGDQRSRRPQGDDEARAARHPCSTRRITGVASETAVDAMRSSRTC